VDSYRHNRREAWNVLVSILKAEEITSKGEIRDDKSEEAAAVIASIKPRVQIG
jgi:hypothetical protein